MNDNISRNILTTVVYYDCLDYPLTAFEIWKYLTEFTNYELSENTNKAEVEKFSLADIFAELNGDTELRKYISEHNGFYFLQGREELVGERIERNKISNSKIKKLRRVVRFLRWLPFVRMAAMTGRLAMKNAEVASDWDLLVVLKKRRIWTGRTLVTGLVHFLGKRRYGKKIKDRVCLNYFITDESLEIATKDLYSANEYFFIWPLFDTGIFQKFQLKNRWLRNFRPNYEISEVANLRIITDNFFTKIIRGLGELILVGIVGKLIEKKLSAWQRQKIAQNPKTHLVGSFVQASDETLVFLPEPQGPEVFEIFKKKLESLNVGN